MSAPQLPPGHVIAGKYSIQAPLGGAGASITYRAVTAQGREVALKLFDTALRQGDAMSTLERVYAAVGQLPPDVVAAVIDAGYDPTTGAPFSATDVLQVPSLARVVQAGPLPPDAVSSVLQALGRALDQAHAMQLFHHSLTPTNIFVGAAPAYTARLTDFGSDVVRRAVPTQEGQAASAPWMAPEQMQGAPAGGAADVFTAALIAFFALTGRSYWRSCQGATPDLAMWSQEIMAPRVPTSARAAELGVSLNPAFDGPLGRALSADPAERYRTVGELAAAVSRVVSRNETAQTAAFPSSAFLAPAGAELAQGATMPAQSWAPGQRSPEPAAGPMAMATQLSGAAPARQSSKLAPILIAVAAMVLVGGAGAAYWVLRGKPVESSPVVVAAAPEVAPKPTVSASAAAPEPPPPTDAPVTLSCSPACDELTIDGSPAAAGARLQAGTHSVVASKKGFVTQTETITVEAGKPFEKQFTLEATPKTAVANPGPAPQPSVKCGKFLKRCKE